MPAARKSSSTRKQQSATGTRGRQAGAGTGRTMKKAAKKKPAVRRANTS